MKEKEEIGQGLEELLVELRNKNNFVFLIYGKCILKEEI